MITNSTGAGTFAITGRKLYVPVLTLLTQDSAKLLQQFKSSFKRKINCNKYRSKVLMQARHPYLDYLIDPSFHRVSRLFVLSFDNNDDRIAVTGNFLPKLEIKNYNVMIDGQKFFNETVKNHMAAYDNIPRITTSQCNDDTICCN